MCENLEDSLFFFLTKGRYTINLVWLFYYSYYVGIIIFFLLFIFIYFYLLLLFFNSLFIFYIFNTNICYIKIQTIDETIYHAFFLLLLLYSTIHHYSFYPIRVIRALPLPPFTEKFHTKKKPY